jgi:O-antigen ligase
MKTLIKTCLWILAFVPLVVDFKVFYPHVSGKNLLIESVLVLVGILFLFNFFYAKNFREEIIGKVLKYIRHPLVIAILAFNLVFVISTIFAVDKYLAFWGSLDRAEGLVGTIFFFSFFTFSLLSFEKKDWLWFFKLSLFTSLILISKEFVEFFQAGILRPGSYTGNPTFLAGYLLFSLLSALIIIKESRNKFWQYFSLFIIILSIVGIFMTQTRGTILGLGLGLFATLIYCVLKGNNVSYKNISVRQMATVFLLLGIIFSGVFIVTRENKIWQKVPGLSRLAIMNTNDEDDPSTQIRFFVYKSALQSINPTQGNLAKLLIGWGPDNFLRADSQYYYAEQYKYEQRWYDRTHNKFLDVLVMNGIFGLLTYLAIWFFLFKFIFKKKEFSLINLGLLLFSVSYLIHLMFVFDQISTSIPFFVVLAFVVYITSLEIVPVSKKSVSLPETKDKLEILSGVFLVILVSFSSFAYFRNTLPGYIQMRHYTALISNYQAKSFERDIDSIFTPFISVQTNIRRNLLEIANKLYNKNPDELNLRLLEKSILKAEDYINKRPLDFVFPTTLVDLYGRKGNSLKNIEYLKRGEELLRQVLVFAPNRPDMNLKLAVNLLYQTRFKESFVLAEKIFETNKYIVDQDKDEFEIIYTRLIQYFYEQKDKESFVKVANRLKENNYAGSASLDKILDYLTKTGTWPNIDFK